MTDLWREMSLLAREALGHHGVIQVLVALGRAAVAVLVLVVIVAAVEVCRTLVLVRPTMLMLLAD